jgi:hypothetical protein
LTGDSWFPGLEDYYLTNKVLKKIHCTLPDELGSKFLMKLHENHDSYYLMKGRQYMDRIISLLRCCYKSLEIALEDTPSLTATTKSDKAKQIGVKMVTGSTGYASSFNSDYRTPDS